MRLTRGILYRIVGLFCLAGLAMGLTACEWGDWDHHHREGWEHHDWDWGHHGHEWDGHGHEWDGHGHEWGGHGHEWGGHGHH